MKNKYYYASALILLIILFFGCINRPINPPIDRINSTTYEPANTTLIEKNYTTFASCNELNKVISQSRSREENSWEKDALGAVISTAVSAVSVPTAAPVPLMAADQSAGSRYSTTNIQVQGVDEADTLKTDGKYIYTISGNRIKIVKATPAAQMNIISEIELDGTPREFFINQDSLLIFSNQYGSVYGTQYAGNGAYDPMPPTQMTKVSLYDISDRTEPKLARQLSFEGDYVSSRLIGSEAYFIINSQISRYGTDKIVPLYKDRNIVSDVAGCNNIGRLPNMRPESFVSVASISMRDFEQKIEKKTFLASAQNIYASKDNIYLAATEYEDESFAQKVADYYRNYGSKEVTAVNRISLLGNGSIRYSGSTKVEGRILNQFSMDEYDGYFRIATTSGHVSRGSDNDAKNNIYVLDEELKQIGALENLARGEQIYSARFMGKKAYLVTFKKVDPLFVIDLSDPQDPRVLGKLKIPGYSDYLHPIDENHLIGIGKDTVEAEEGNFAWYQGVKMAVFDVSDVNHPKEMFKEIIGERGSDSPVLSDHRAFLYDREKELLVIPVSVAEVSESQYGRTQANTYGQEVFQGAYVYDLSLEDGFDLRGEITHREENYDRYGNYRYEYDRDITRSLFIGNTLYTVSETMIKANSLGSLRELGSVELR
ncbi:beta-propeller domain-containing protein [Candidatus Micrarchaeota archaeon]|nr:beta-propeller domain-containing protein [Candidatus Micrarchaeota archaeon]